MCLANPQNDGSAIIARLRTFRGLGVFLALLLAVLPAHAKNKNETVATTNVSIRLPDCIILHYYSGLTINFEQFSSSIDEGAAEFDVQFTGETQERQDIGTESRELSIPNRVSLELPNVWAIRGLSPSGNAKVSIAVTRRHLISGPSRITIASGSGNIEIEDNYGHSGTNINTNLNGIGTAEATIGNVRMTLDFSETTRAGLHTGGQYKITAETI
ncbi:hypothetical protein CHL67_05220 [Prosthecochloris sp. GSB1]|nr:hypothetical protein CHL67_05220 [Prosthecochloris sp. GSB1]